MRAIVRRAITVLAAGLALGTPAALAQEAPPPETNTTSDDQVGPRELEDFNLQGTVTRPAEPATNTNQPATRAPATTSPARAPEPRASDRTSRPEPRTTSVTERRESPAPAAERPTASVTMQLPPIGDSPIAPPEIDQAAPALAPSTPPDRVPISWILAALAVLAGAGFYAWRSRHSAAYAGGPALDRFDPSPAPSPAPTPRSNAATAPAIEPEPLGVVSTRMRPSLEIAFRPTRCAIDEDNFTLEFELGLFNSGNSPARAILVEASFFNAGPVQDQQIEQFFANPAGVGGRAISLAPMKRMIIRNKLITPRDQVQEYEVGGRKVFVPLIAFNALYRWSGGEGQTSASFMIGRKTGGEKLAPFRLDMVGREFRSVGKRPLPTSLHS